MKMVGIERNITFHAGRHTFAVNSLLLGMDIKVLSVLLGHGSVLTTEIYYAKIVEQLRQANIEKWSMVK